MTDFQIYYNSKFRDDINRFFSSIPDASKFHEDTENKQFFSIQYERLTPSFDHLDFLRRPGGAPGEGRIHSWTVRERMDPDIMRPLPKNDLEVSLENCGVPTVG